MDITDVLEEHEIRIISHLNGALIAAYNGASAVADLACMHDQCVSELCFDYMFDSVVMAAASFIAEFIGTGDDKADKEKVDAIGVAFRRHLETCRAEIAASVGPVGSPDKPAPPALRLVKGGK